MESRWNFHAMIRIQGQQGTLGLHSGTGREKEIARGRERGRSGKTEEKQQKTHSGGRNNREGSALQGKHLFYPFFLDGDGMEGGWCEDRMTANTEGE